MIHRDPAASSKSAECAASGVASAGSEIAKQTAKNTASATAKGVTRFINTPIANQWLPYTQARKVPRWVRPEITGQSGAKIRFSSPDSRQLIRNDLCPRNHGGRSWVQEYLAVISSFFTPRTRCFFPTLINASSALSSWDLSRPAEIWVLILASPFGTTG